MAHANLKDWDAKRRHIKAYMNLPVFWDTSRQPSAFGSTRPR
jgi:hypothetical protein